MPSRSRILTKDEELGKRDDDFRPKLSQDSAMSPLLPWHWRRRRLVLAILLIGIIYLLVQNVPAPVSQDQGTPLGSVGPDQPSTFPSYPPASRSPTEPKGAPPREKSIEEDEAMNHYYNGPIKFWKLGGSLQTMPMTMGSMTVNRNILFAASSLKSLANLLPLACEMAKQNQAYPHVALFGRSTIPMPEILEINGVHPSTCTAYFHDARGDFAEFSSDSRAQMAVAGAMVHIQTYMHPQALIVDDHSLENRFFLDAMTQKSLEMDRPLIEIPKGRYEDFLWITRLDAGSISSWYKPTVDIVVQAPPESAGSLIRLLKSLSSADYSGIKVPRLTVELPGSPEAFVVGFLARMNWPPTRDESQRLSNALTVRHRIPSSRITAEQASLRFFESFFPNDPNTHHTLILSPQAQVDPHFMHFLHYSILKYRHSSFGTPGSEDVLGISLDVRNDTLNGTHFLTPTQADMVSWKYRQDDNPQKETLVPYLFQAPSSSAALIFGDKWVALHSFMTNRVASTHLGKASKIKKLVSETEPSWVEYLLELMRARGWTMMHPASSFVTLHNEMAQIPAEFVRQSDEASETITNQLNASTVSGDEAFVTAKEAPLLKEHEEHDISKNSGPLHRILPLDGVLPDIYEMPCYSHDGELLQNLELTSRVSDFKTYFRTTVGGCTPKEAERFRQADWLDTDDLFCLPGIDIDTSDEAFEPEQYESDELLSRLIHSMEDEADPVREDDVESKVDPLFTPSEDKAVYNAKNTTLPTIKDETEADLTHGLT